MAKNRDYFFYVRLILFIIFLSSCNGWQKGRIEYISGTVISIIDGDTFELLTNEKKTVKVRMEGIDAPERGMPFYKVSKNFLSRLCYNKFVKIQIIGKDRYGRYLGYTFLNNGTELSHEMIKAGLAWHFKKYNSSTDLSSLEMQAKNQKRGLWIENRPMSPWDNRNLHYKGISTIDSFNIKIGQE